MEMKGGRKQNLMFGEVETTSYYILNVGMK